MERTSVISSNIQSVGYDPSAEILEVGFKDGSVYQYQGVPSNEHEGIMSSGSKGKYLNERIKGRYHPTKL